MKCNIVIDRVLRSEGNFLPLLVRLHLLHCRQCRSEELRIRRSVSAMRGYYPFPAAAGLSDAVMRNISLGAVQYQSRISNQKWLGAGLILFVSIFLASYSETRVWLAATYGDLFEIPFNIVMGIAITSYAVLFIGSHLDSLRNMGVTMKKWGFRKF